MVTKKCSFDLTKFGCAFLVKGMHFDVLLRISQHVLQNKSGGRDDLYSFSSRYIDQTKGSDTLSRHAGWLGTPSRVSTLVDTRAPA